MGGEIVNACVAGLVFGPAGRYKLVDEGADRLAGGGREMAAVLRDLLVVAMRLVDRPVGLLERS
jgi:hypothetical protein